MINLYLKFNEGFSCLFNFNTWLIYSFKYFLKDRETKYRKRRTQLMA